MYSPYRPKEAVLDAGPFWMTVNFGRPSVLEDHCNFGPARGKAIILLGVNYTLFFWHSLQERELPCSAQAPPKFVGAEL